MAQRIIRVYVDSSVFGGVHDIEFSRPSRVFFDVVRERKITPVISALVRRELDLVPQPVIEELQEILPMAEVFPVEQESFALRDAYLHARIVTTRWSGDALHVAVAIVSGCSVIVSWNFKHTVNYRKIPLYNAVNRTAGYHDLAIHSPWEVIGEEGI